MHETTTTGDPAAAELRLRFKAICAATEHKFQNYQIRVHRALSRTPQTFCMLNRHKRSDFVVAPE